MIREDSDGGAPAVGRTAAGESSQAPPAAAEGRSRPSRGTARRGRPARAEDGPREEAAGEPDERYLRLAADFENYRRRNQQELLDRSRYASEAAARALLPVLDNLRRAIEHATSDGAESRLRDGLDLVVREFEAGLGGLGVVPIEAVGAPFDPALHEAIGAEESDEVDTETVTQELLRGYRLHDRVLRPAMVRIARPRAG